MEANAPFSVPSPANYSSDDYNRSPSPANETFAEKRREKRKVQEKRNGKNLGRIHDTPDVEEHEDEESEPRRKLTAMAALKAIMATRKFRNNLKKKKRRRLFERYDHIKSRTSKEAEKEVEAFRSLLADQNLLPPAHDDYFTMLRFLKARKFDMQKAKVMWSDWLKWRDEVGADTIENTFIYEEQNRVKEHYPHGNHGVDRDGRPVYIELVGQVDASKVLEHTTLDRYVKYHIKEFEKCFSTRFPACSISAGFHIDQSTTIMDVSGFGMKNFSRDARDLLSRISKIDSDYYPETLHRLYIINANVVFRGIWSTIKSLLDPKTVSKIQVLGNKYHDQVFKAIHPDELPSILGGNCNCPDGCLFSDKGPWQDPDILKVLRMRHQALSEPNQEFSKRRLDYSGSLKDAESESESLSDVDDHKDRRLNISKVDMEKMLPMIGEELQKDIMGNNSFMSTESFREIFVEVVDKSIVRHNSFKPGTSKLRFSRSLSSEISSDDESGEFKLASTSSPPSLPFYDIPHHQFRQSHHMTTTKTLSVSSTNSSSPFLDSKALEKRAIDDEIRSDADSSMYDTESRSLFIRWITCLYRVFFNFKRFVPTVKMLSLFPHTSMHTSQVTHSTPEIPSESHGYHPPLIDHSTPSHEDKIMLRVENLERKLEDFNSKPEYQKEKFNARHDWPKDASDRVKSLEEELNETKKTLKELSARQADLVNTLENLKPKKRKKFFGCLG